MFRLLWLLGSLVSLVSSSCYVGPMENLVAFGDSYSDEGRSKYFAYHHGIAPPAGKLLPASNYTSTGGYTWGRFVADKTKAKYYDYAVGGATCSNSIVSRRNPAINAPFPSVLDYEVPAFETDVELENLYPDRRADNTVYALWIGTNDLGFLGFLTDSQKANTSLSTYVDCNWEVFDRMYESGGRRFVLMNTMPLERSQTYMAGSGNGPFWPNHTRYDQDRYERRMGRYTRKVNAMFDFGAAFNVLVRRRWPGATLTVFDVHSLVEDMYASPDVYLDAPANATGCYKCEGTHESRSSFLW